MIETKTPTILIVDDDPDDIELATMAVEAAECGVKVKAAMSGRAALAFLRSAECLPALILLDLKMPGMSGIDTLREIRSDTRLEKIPVVIVTSSSLESDRKATFEAGADSFMQKAFDMSRFSKDMKTLLGRYLKA